MTQAAKDFISHKISILIAEGKPRKQAIAIAYNMAREIYRNVPDTPKGSPAFVKRAVKMGRHVRDGKKRQRKRR